ncbi:MAG: RNA polymerase sigma factor [Phycisphaerales bacterium]
MGDHAAALPRVPLADQSAPDAECPPCASDNSPLGATAERRAAIDHLYARHARMVYAVALGFLSPADADDAVQEVFMKAIQRLGELRGASSTGPWLAAIARTVSLDRLRKSSRHRRKIEEMSRRATAHHPHASGPAAPLDADDALAAIRSLPESYREPLMLRLVEGLTGPQIAEQLGMTPGSVRVNLCHGMRQLRSILGWEDTP